jgi:simple sugar transport system permease protein
MLEAKETEAGQLIAAPTPTVTESESRPKKFLSLTNLEGFLRFILALAGALVVFGLLLLVLGKDPLRTYSELFKGSLGDTYGWGEVVVKMVPFILCALATAIPARNGLVNVGGDGQFYAGAWFTTLLALNLGSLPALVLIPLLIAAGCLGGALWAGLVGWLRSAAGLNETISSLLLNYVAILIVQYFVHDPWKDPTSFNWPYTAQFSDSARLATLGDTRVSLGIVFALIAVGFYFWLMKYTRWGYEMQVVGGNPEAAKRSGIPINRYLIIAMMLGGAMAGLAGMIEVTAIQGRLRDGISGGYGYIGFLVAWLAGQQPWRIILMAALLGIISVGGDVVQIAISLPSSTVNILMALILFFVLGTQRWRLAGGK